MLGVSYSIDFRISVTDRYCCTFFAIYQLYDPLGLHVLIDFLRFWSSISSPNPWILAVRVASCFGMFLCLRPYSAALLAQSKSSNGGKTGKGSQKNMSMDWFKRTFTGNHGFYH